MKKFEFLEFNGNREMQKNFSQIVSKDFYGRSSWFTFILKDLLKREENSDHKVIILDKSFFENAAKKRTEIKSDKISSIVFETCVEGKFSSEK